MVLKIRYDSSCPYFKYLYIYLHRHREVNLIMNLLILIGCIFLALSILLIPLTDFNPYVLHYLATFVGIILIVFGYYDIVNNLNLFLILLGILVALISLDLYWKTTPGPRRYGFDWVLIFAWIQYLLNQFIMPITLIVCGIIS